MTLSARLRMALSVLTVALCNCAALTWPMFAEDYPSRPIHIVVPYGPGASTDLLARAVADVTSKKYGWTFVIESRPGAGPRSKQSESVEPVFTPEILEQYTPPTEAEALLILSDTYSREGALDKGLAAVRHAEGLIGPLSPATAMREGPSSRRQAVASALTACTCATGISTTPWRQPGARLPLVSSSPCDPVRLTLTRGPGAP